MGNHPVWKNSLFLWPFSIAMCIITKGSIQHFKKNPTCPPKSRWWIDHYKPRIEGFSWIFNGLLKVSGSHTFLTAQCLRCCPAADAHSNRMMATFVCRASDRMMRCLRAFHCAVSRNNESNIYIYIYPDAPCMEYLPTFGSLLGSGRCMYIYIYITNIVMPTMPLLVDLRLLGWWNSQ